MSRVTSWQRRLLVFGAFFDAAFAIPMLLFPDVASGLIRVPIPADPTWFRLSGVLLLLVAGCYVVAARAPEGVTHAVGGVAAAGRLLGCLVLVEAGLDGPAALLATGFLDGLLGLLHLALAAAWRRSNDSSPLS